MVAKTSLYTIPKFNRMVSLPPYRTANLSSLKLAKERKALAQLTSRVPSDLFPENLTVAKEIFPMKLKLGKVDMKRKYYTEEQIIGILHERTAGLPANEVIRKHGIANGTFYRWKSK